MKTRVIIKRPDEDYGHLTNISFSMDNLQKTVGGPIEVVNIGNSLLGEPLRMIINEEGKLRNLPFNFMLPQYGGWTRDFIVGTVIVCGMNEAGDNFGNIPITFKEWKNILDKMRGCA